MSAEFERLLQEHCDLSIKIHRLEEFLLDYEYKYDRVIYNISDASYELLRKQLSIMLKYLEILEKRIKLWKEEH